MKEFKKAFFGLFLPAIITVLFVLLLFKIFVF